jgi:hypothetical protein
MSGCGIRSTAADGWGPHVGKSPAVAAAATRTAPIADAHIVVRAEGVLSIEHIVFMRCYHVGGGGLLQG